MAQPRKNEPTSFQDQNKRNMAKDWIFRKIGERLEQTKHGSLKSIHKLKQSH